MRKVQIAVVVTLVVSLVVTACYWIHITRTPQPIIANVARNKTDSGPGNGEEEEEKRKYKQRKASAQQDNEKKNSEGDNSQPQDHVVKIQSAQQAIETAKKLLGWDNGVVYSAERITIKHCIVPFVRKHVIGKSAWKVTVRDVKLKFRRGEAEEEHENPYVQELECIILAETGLLLQIESKIPKGMTIKPDRVPVEQVERRYGSEKIKGLPSGPPQLPFSQILQRAFEEHGGWISTAKQIIAFFVIDAYGEHEEIWPAQPLWLIHVRGFSPPMPLPSGGSPRPGQEARDPGSIDHMRLPFKEDGTPFGEDNMRAPK